MLRVEQNAAAEKAEAELLSLRELLAQGPVFLIKIKIIPESLDRHIRKRAVRQVDLRGAGLAQRLIVDDRCEQARGGAAVDGAELFVVAEQSHNSLSLLFLCR